MVGWNGVGGFGGCRYFGDDSGRFNRKERREHREMTTVGCDRFGRFMKGFHEPLEPMINRLVGPIPAGGDCEGR